MSELDKTIEELEAEVQAELEEASHDAPKKGAAKGDSMEKAEGEVQDLGGAGEASPEAKSASHSNAAKAKKISGDAQQKGAKGDMGGDAAATKVKEPLAAGDQLDHDGEEIEEGVMKKSDMLAAMYSEMEKMKATELKAAYGAMMKKDEEKEEEKVEESTLEDRLSSVDVSEDVAALTEGEELSEEFKTKASTIFEAAVKSKVRTEIERLEDEYSKELTEQSDKAKDELVEKVDSYLDYVVQEWMKENELAIERGLKGEISEDFIAGLKQLFEDHYIDVPDEKYDVLEAQSKKIEELEEQLNLQIEKDKELHSEIGELTKDSIIKDVSDDLVDTEVEKFKGLVEDVDYSDAESYKSKLETLKESYFPKRAEEQSTNEISDDEPVNEVETSGKMAEYMSAISKTHERAK